MKKKSQPIHIFRRSGFLVCIFLILFSCNNDRDNAIIEPENIPVNFTAVKDEGTGTRVTGNNWDNGDQIGIFTIEHQSTLAPENIFDNNNNLPFETKGSGIFFPKGKKIYYPQDETAMDVIAYYPYTETLSNDYIYSVDITQQIDFFYSNNLTGLSKTNTSDRELNFKRPLSMLILNISPTTEGASLDGLTATMSGAKTKASFSLSENILIPDEGSVKDFPLPIVENVTGKQIKALLLPTIDNDQLKISFKLGTKTYTWELPHQLSGGKRYSYNIKLEGSGEVVLRSSYMEMPVYSNGAEAPNSVLALHMVSTSWLKKSYSYDTDSTRNYSILFDTENVIPYWVAYPMHPIYLGSAKRTNEWQYDPIIPENMQPELYSSYTGNWSRGHLLASADRDASRDINKTTFYFTNMAPQNQGMNGGTWVELENRVRYWCNQTTYDTLYVVTGCILPTPPEQLTYTNDKAGNKVTVPKYLYKALLRKKKSSGEYSSIAFKMENRNTGIAYDKSVVSVKELEEETGFLFFPNLPSEVSQSVKQNKSLSPYWN